MLTNTKQFPRSLQSSAEINTPINNYNAIVRIISHLDGLIQVPGSVVKMILDSRGTVDWGLNSGSALGFFFLI